MIFDVLKSLNGDRITARLGRLAVPGRNVIQTPGFFGVATRGAVPHLTPDNVFQHKPFQGTYLALEDCTWSFALSAASSLPPPSLSPRLTGRTVVEKYPRALLRRPPIYEMPATGRPRLHAFTALPPEVVTILAPRRHPAATAKMGNNKDSISIYTATGVQQLATTEYNTAVTVLQPDIAVPMADLNYDTVPPSSKRAVRLAERSEDWMNQLSTTLPPETLREAHVSLFAPTLPVPHETQWQYLNTLSELSSTISGLAIYDTAILPCLVEYSSLLPLPRLSLSPASTPHAVLSDVSLGVDLFILPFVNTASESGVALTFTFPPPPRKDAPHQLGVDLSQPEHTTAFTPLANGCTCYACTSHHRAFLRHLLDAREMLAWTLLQIHNHATLQAFFQGIRATLADGTFEAAREEFGRVYEAELPAGQGVKPRQRGYHIKSRGGDDKINQPAWGRLEERIGGAADRDSVRVGDIKKTDVSEAPHVPDVDPGELDRI